MSHRSAILAAVSALALIGAGSALAADPAPVPTPPPSDAANPPVSAPIKVDMQTFTTNAAVSDMYEVKAAELALERSTSKSVKDFASMMKKAHTETTKALAPLAKTAGATVPTELDTAHTDKLKALTDATDAEFDKTYIDQQVSAHETALALFEAYGATGDNEQLIAFAKDTAPKIETHLNHAKEIQKGREAAKSPAN
jgi:putative membrane protein